MLKNVFFKIIFDENQSQKLNSLKSKTEMYNLFCENGYTKSFDEFEKEIEVFLNSEDMQKIINSDFDELSDEMLEMIAGGSFWDDPKFKQRLTGLTAGAIAAVSIAAIGSQVFNQNKETIKDTPPSISYSDPGDSGFNDNNDNNDNNGGGQKANENNNEKDPNGPQAMKNRKGFGKISNIFRKGGRGGANYARRGPGGGPGKIASNRRGPGSGPASFDARPGDPNVGFNEIQDKIKQKQEEKERLAKLEKEKLKKEKEIEQKKKEDLKKQQQEQDKIKQIKEKQDKIKQINEQRQNLQKQLNELNLQLNNFRLEQDNLQKILLSMKNRLTTEEKRFSKLEKNIKELEDKKKEINANHKKDPKELQNNSNWQQINNTINKQLEEKDKSLTSINDIKAKIKQKFSRLAALDEKIKQTSSKIAELNSQLKKLDEKFPEHQSMAKQPKPSTIKSNSPKKDTKINMISANKKEEQKENQKNQDENKENEENEQNQSETKEEQSKKYEDTYKNAYEQVKDNVNQTFNEAKGLLNTKDLAGMKEFYKQLNNDIHKHGSNKERSKKDDVLLANILNIDIFILQKLANIIEQSKDVPQNIQDIFRDFRVPNVKDKNGLLEKVLYWSRNNAEQVFDIQEKAKVPILNKNVINETYMIVERVKNQENKISMDMFSFITAFHDIIDKEICYANYNYNAYDKRTNNAIDMLEKQLNLLNILKDNFNNLQIAQNTRNKINVVYTDINSYYNKLINLREEQNQPNQNNNYNFNYYDSSDFDQQNKLKANHKYNFNYDYDNQKIEQNQDQNYNYNYNYQSSYGSKEITSVPLNFQYDSKAAKKFDLQDFKSQIDRNVFSPLNAIFQQHILSISKNSTNNDAMSNANNILSQEISSLIDKTNTILSTQNFDKYAMHSFVYAKKSSTITDIIDGFQPIIDNLSNNTDDVILAKKTAIDMLELFFSQTFDNIKYKIPKLNFNYTLSNYPSSYGSKEITSNQLNLSYDYGSGVNQQIGENQENIENQIIIEEHKKENQEEENIEKEDNNNNNESENKKDQNIEQQPKENDDEIKVIENQIIIEEDKKEDQDNNEENNEEN